MDRETAVSVPFYDELDYDRFVNWPKRLAYELPFIEKQLANVRAHDVLDIACGSGKHALALARRGYQVLGADLSPAMIARARQNAAAQEGSLPGGVEWVVAGFGQLADQTNRRFDAALCLGNSLPHVLTTPKLDETLGDLAAILRPDGLLLVQNRNFDAVVSARSRWLAPQSHRENGHEWLFVRFYDFNADGTLTFHMITLQRDAGSTWTQHTAETLLRPWTRSDLDHALRRMGFDNISAYGDMQGAPWGGSSSNLVLVARRAV
jgi:glycine/sarcosine N-methyltransferase